MPANGAIAAQSKETSTVDVRILVDVSGSMKKNDPKHLRIPAVNLLTGILPKNATSGIWMFAEKTETLQPVSKISKEWKHKVRERAKLIHDRGLFTNIGQALETAITGWKGPDNLHNRMIVLLTDGKVDISKDDNRNEKEKQRIENQLIPELKKLGVRVYNIALSDEADKELLAKISNSTDAWFEAVNNAEELEKVFLKIFEQSVNVPEVPIAKNRFQIDHSVKEFTALIFKKPGEAIYLKSPSGEKYESETMESSITWYSENKFDLITITDPEAGKWQIIGPVDKDNRVMVVSNLKLDVNNEELPANLVFGEELDVQVSLKEKGKIIKRPSFLSLVNFVGRISATNIDQDLVLQDDGMVDDKVKEDGIFEFKFKAPKIDDEVSFDIRVMSPTFERLYHRSIRVYSTYLHINKQLADKKNPVHKIIISPIKGLIDDKSLEIDGKLNTPLGIDVDLVFKRNKQGQWVSEIKPNEIGGNYNALINIKGTTLSGKSFELNDQKIDFEVPRKASDTDKTKKEKEEPVQSQNNAEKTTSNKKEQPKQVDQNKPEKQDSKSEKPEKPQPEVQKDNPVETKGLSNLWWIIIGVVFNVVFFGGGFLLWKRWKNKQSAEDQDLSRALEEDEPATAEGE